MWLPQYELRPPLHPALTSRDVGLTVGTTAFGEVMLGTILGPDNKDRKVSRRNKKRKDGE